MDEMVAVTTTSKSTGTPSETSTMGHGRYSDLIGPAHFPKMPHESTESRYANKNTFDSGVSIATRLVINSRLESLVQVFLISLWVTLKPPLQPFCGRP